mmetsp:Transcript_32140/g.46334  ORF Transcript_32140/g.46334 Transcript_32140/m.46334 type:complete len:266 (-) Transcript_32140:1564-2361(-)
MSTLSFGIVFLNMIRNVIIMQQSGLVLFSKEFINSIAQPRLVGSLITAIIEFGQQTTGMGVCFIELTHVSITIVTNDVAKIFCALFYDREDGVIFGRLVCSEILNAFTQEYSSDLTQFGRNLKDFHGFHRKINNVVKLSAKPILLRLEGQVGIRKVLLINNGEIIDTPNSRVDQLGLLSSLSFITELCNDILASVDDSFHQMTLKSSDDNIIYLWKVHETSVLVVIADKSVGRELFVPHIEEALEIIEQVCILYSNLQQVSNGRG